VIILPRQARDKHRGNSKRRDAFSSRHARIAICSGYGDGGCRCKAVMGEQQPRVLLLIT
jgi:hypothetical protein